MSIRRSPPINILRKPLNQTLSLCVSGSKQESEQMDTSQNHATFSGREIISQISRAILHLAKRATSTGSNVIAQSKYLLFQEKCRICKRCIHPELSGMDYQSFRPPATYMLNDRELSCDCICRTCWLSIYSSHPRRSACVLVYPNGESQHLWVTSAIDFAGEAKKLI
jgi:hypothetical protein